jgi:hypothetical protein
MGLMRWLGWLRLMRWLRWVGWAQLPKYGRDPFLGVTWRISLVSPRSQRKQSQRDPGGFPGLCLSAASRFFRLSSRNDFNGFAT